MPHRLGDDIDDFCIKCKRVTNHAIVSLMDERAAKVRCRTCYHDHDFRNEVPLPSKKDLKKAALFQEVLAKGGMPEDGDLPDAQDDLGEDADAGDPGEAAEPEPEPVPVAVAVKKAAKKAKK